jgi:ABC-type nickel/cobalt efflux system permease component RcnA
MTDGASTYQRPHRGTLILMFGILGLVVCFPFGIAAWVMGGADIAAMNRGEMDRSGESITNTGRILGIISVVLAAIGVLVALALLVAVAGGASRY